MIRIDREAVEEALDGTQWIHCEGCGRALLDSRLNERHGVCRFCGYHHRISALAHIALLIDLGTFEEQDRGLTARDPLDWHDGTPYAVQHRATVEKLGIDESFLYGRAAIDSQPVLVGAFEFRFFGGTLGSVAGERIARMFERGTSDRLPVVVVTRSGGARMQEGLYSLYQMPKIVGAIRRFQDRGGFCLNILCDPTTGGVAASLGFLGDVVIAEPGALIGFSGPRVIREAIGQELPQGMQQSENLLANGLIDAVVPRVEQRAYAIQALRVATS